MAESFAEPMCAATRAAASTLNYALKGSPTARKHRGTIEVGLANRFEPSLHAGSRPDCIAAVPRCHHLDAHRDHEVVFGNGTRR